jgi:hypothetical protein
MKQGDGLRTVICQVTVCSAVQWWPVTPITNLTEEFRVSLQFFQENTFRLATTASFQVFTYSPFITTIFLYHSTLCYVISEVDAALKMAVETSSVRGIHHVETRAGTHPASYPMVTGDKADGA